MPRNLDIKKVLIIGAGPITIGQACEFDYSGTQACRALKEEGCEVILINSNPATIMTDPTNAHAVYIEPIECEIIERIIQKHRPEAILPTMGGQTALNCALKLYQKGILEKYNVKLIGLEISTIEKAEDRNLFKEIVTSRGLAVPRSFYVRNMQEVDLAQGEIGFPLIIRTSYTLGGEGGGVVYDANELEEKCQRAFRFSQGLLLEESIIGWKEYELELMRDKLGNCIVVCGIENVDPMGVHTGDSITVAPIQTLTDKEYQKMRLAAFSIMDAIGMTSGGCNVQFAVQPESGKMYCIEINPRVSRSSALASKATGFPIAKIAAKIALGYQLDELKNELSNPHFPSSFEPVIDYVVTKIPRFNFEKFSDVDQSLTTHMKSIGESMAVGRTFKESFLKALFSLDLPLNNLYCLPMSLAELNKQLRIPQPDRIFLILEAFRRGISIGDIQSATSYDLWFLSQFKELIEVENEIKATGRGCVNKEQLTHWKQAGFPDEYIAHLLDCHPDQIAQTRAKLSLSPVYKRIDTCAGEFPNEIAYMYSSYEEECESEPTNRKKIVILGSGPNRIGQGIEFDYCCVQALKAAQELGYEAIIINCNPETVSTDYDVADRLYFEPLIAEYVLEVLRIERPIGVLIQVGGQTPLKIGHALCQKGYEILGTPFAAIDIAEDRGKFRHFANEFGLKQPKNFAFSSHDEALTLAEEIGYPLVLRPSFVIGGSSIQIVETQSQLQQYLAAHSNLLSAPILIEEFLQNWQEVELDAICDGKDVFICGLVEQVDPTGVHSGDSICLLSPFKLAPSMQVNLIEQTEKIGLGLGIVGFYNVQYAVQGEEIVVLEVNPRASRTIPLLSKITGLNLVQIAMKCILGCSLAEQKLIGIAKPMFCAVKLPVFPFSRLNVKDEGLGPQMKSTGEVLCLGCSFEEAFAKARIYCQDSKLFSKPTREQVLKLNKSMLHNSIRFDLCNIPCGASHLN